MNIQVDFGLYIKSNTKPLNYNQTSNVNIQNLATLLLERKNWKLRIFIFENCMTIYFRQKIFYFFQVVTR